MMTREIVAGFVPLLDCAILVAASERGFARAEGLELILVRETSWANIRDRVIVGHFDVAHMLGPMALASSLGLGHLQVPMIAPIALGLGGNAITVSTDLWRQMVFHGASAGGATAPQGKALAAVIRERARSGASPLAFAMVYPFSCHNYELRYWLAASGIDPDRDLNLIVLPPPLLVSAMRENQIDGFCVGEPWNSLAVDSGVGCIVTATSDVWRRSPEKVLGMRTDWAQLHPEETAALIRACYRAAEWCASPANRIELAALLAQSKYINAPQEVLQRGLTGNLRVTDSDSTVHRPEFLLFAPHLATRPSKSHAIWFYAQMLRWAQAAPTPWAARAAQDIYRPDLYRLALANFRTAPPTEEMSIIPGDDFFDEQEFDPREFLGSRQD